MRKFLRPLRIGIIGGGRRCEALLEMLDAGRLSNFDAKVVAVADPNMDAVGIRMAQKRGIYTTRDYKDFNNIKGLDFVIDLSDQKSSVLDDFRKDALPEVRTLETAFSGLLHDLIRFRNEHLLEKRQLDINEGIVESIFSSIHDEVVVIRPDLKIVDTNEAFIKSSGEIKENIVGKHCYEIVHQSDAPCREKNEQCPVMESLKTGSTAHAIHEHFLQEDRSFYYEITTVPLKNEKGEIELLLSIMRDITDELERRVEERTQNFKRNLARLIHEDKMIALGKLVSSAVHEINNPLSGILALARLMYQKIEEGNVGEEDLREFKYYLHLIDTEAARCSNIVGNLLSFSRQQKTEHKYFQLNDVIQRVVLLFGHKMELHRTHLKLELCENLPEMLGNAGQIQQCLINLLFNAMEAMPNGGEVTIRTYFEKTHNFIGMEVEDSGPGIPKEIISQIFEPFFSTKQQDKGVGLGLSVVYGIIKDHQGSIYVKNEVGKGANFIIRFFLPQTEMP